MPKMNASRMATARYDYESVGQGSSVERLAMILRIPLGYQDDAGFHCGEPQIMESEPVFEPESSRNETYQF
jgi:hypothetical protein